MAKTFQELTAWQLAMDLVEKIYCLLRAFPRDERYALCDQLRRAVVSIPSNIAEGFGRDSDKDFAHFVSQARGSLYETMTQLEIARRLHYLSEDVELDTLLQRVSKVLGSLHRYLKNTTPPRTKHQAPGTKHQAP